MPTRNAAIFRSAKPREKPFKLSDGGGLYLLVQPNGTKLRRLAYRYDGKQKLLALGQYPVISLTDARIKRDDAKKLLSDGIDPMPRKYHRRKMKNSRLTKRNVRVRTRLPPWSCSADRTRLQANSLLTGNFTGNFAISGLPSRLLKNSAAFANEA
jgi:Arm DNA-binding domain